MEDNVNPNNKSKSLKLPDALVEKAKSLKNAVEKKQNELKISSEEKKRQHDLEKYCPIFEKDLNEDMLQYERIIRFVNYDPRLENEVCKGSVGFYEVTKDRKIPTFYLKYVPKLNLTFYPQLSESVFIADPCIPGKYIEVDEYYSYMKQVRVNELTVIAQSLGAKHIVISLNGSETKSVQTNVSASAGASVRKEGAGASFDRLMKHKSKNTVDVWADTTFKQSVWNNSPVVPTVLYFRNESDISSLIQMATMNKGKLTRRVYRMEASTSSGLALSEAASISSSMRAIKCNAGANLENKAVQESKSFLEYTIDF